MKRTLRFLMHELSALRSAKAPGKYLGLNPFTKKRDDLLVDDHRDFIIVKSDGFIGTWIEFQAHYKNELALIWEKSPKAVLDLSLQRKLFKIDNQIEDLALKIKKLQKKFQPILKGSKRIKHYFDSEFEVSIQFYVSKKHSAYDPDDDNLVYEDDFWNNKKGNKYVLDRREKTYFSPAKFNPKYQKLDWSSITYYLYSNCSREDIMCIDSIIVDIKSLVQLSQNFE
jgi:hypothetical protein